MSIIEVGPDFKPEPIPKLFWVLAVLELILVCGFAINYFLYSREEKRGYPLNVDAN